MVDRQTFDFGQSVGVLRQFRGDRSMSQRPVEKCELCSAALRSNHSHLLELTSREVLCSCDACAVLFDGLERAKFKRIPSSVEYLTNFRLTDAQWDSLFIPIQLAFFFRSSLEGRTLALYPSPAGAVESLLPIETWKEIVEDNPKVRPLQPDVDALLVNRIEQPGRHAEYFIAPIDQCYRLVGLIRLHWKGLSGGAEVWDEIDRFFAELHERVEFSTGAPHA